MTATGTGRGRGRPAAGDGFTTEAQGVFLDAVAAGAKQADAAAKAGVSRNVPSRYAKTDAGFAAALTEAKARGRAVRAETMPHSEAHYNHYDCRAPECRALATAARTTRRAAAEEDTAPADPIPLNGRAPSSSPSFPLAKAS
ncbi:hypothetical protein ACH4GZ_38845 [Streptomyces hygroscopicus]|uniref:hypothetical protein n=1 Tax=Streptomyces hygroscopicus TaxID=1912 RepID=UPI0037AC2FD5